MDFTDGYNDKPLSYLMKITAHYSYIYDFIWIDTSSFRTISFATIYNAYIPDTAWA